MADIKTVRDKIIATKALVAENSISPTYLGNLLDEMLSLLDSYASADTLDSISASVNSINTATKKLDTAVKAAAPRSVELAELDTMGTDGSVGQMLAFAVGKENHTLWALCQNGMKVGTVSVFADFGPHVLYQIITTSNDVVDGKLQGSHRDGRLHTFWRCFGITENPGDYPVGEWTPWQPFGAQTPIECADEADMAAKAASDAYPEGTQFFIAETD